MSKSSTATAPKIPAKSAWARGPPQSSSTAPSPRSQSPAPSTPVVQSHSRRPSALGQGIPIKDGVSIPRNNVGAVKQASAVTFGSIDDVPTPISSSPAAAPPIKSDGVKTFGSVPVGTGHVNGKPSISSRPPVVPPMASTSTAASSVLSAAAPPMKPKIDIKKMFQSPSSAPSSNLPSDTSSPSIRNVGLPNQQQQPHQGQSPHTAPNPSQLAHSFTPFVPGNNMRQPQSNGPNGGPPRSPQYPRQMSNGNGPRSQGGQNGGPPAGLSSPRLASHPHNSQSSTMPPPPPPQMQHQMQPQMHQPMWYYQYPDQPHFMPYQQWGYNPMQMPQHQPPPHPPHPGSQIPHTGLPMSPRNPPSALQGPSTPTLSHTIASPVHPPHSSSLSHSSNSLGLTSPSPTPSTPISGGNRLDGGSRTFVPRTANKVTLKNADGTEVSLVNLTKSAPTPSTPAVSSSQTSVLRQGSPGTPNRRPTSIRMETEDQHKSRLAEQEQNDRLKVEAADKERKEKAEAERKAKVAVEIRELEAARFEKEQKERVRKQEEERLRKEAEALELQRLKEEEARRQKLKQEEERILKAKQEEEERRLKSKQEEEERILKAKQEEEKALRLAQEKVKEEKERKEKEEREEQERVSKLAEETRLRLEEEAAAKAKAEAISEPEPEERTEAELEAHKGDGKQDGQLEDGKDVDTETSKSLEDGKDKLKDVLRINTTSINSLTNDKRRPGPLNLSATRSPVVAALATARVIADIATVSYPEGVHSPHPDLNQNVKNGKFRYDREFLLQFMSFCKERPATLPPLDAIGLESVDHTHAMSRGGSGHRPSSAIPPSRQASVGLGFNPSGLGKPGANNLFNGMGNFATGAGSKLSSEERYANSNRAASVSGALGMQYTGNRPSTMQRTASQGGAGAPLQKRVRSKRGENRNENNRAPGGSGGQGHGSGFNNNMNQMQNFDPVVPLQATENRWDRKAIQVDHDSPELVERKVKGLLNKLTMEKFAPISDQIITWANKSEKEKDGRTLIQVIRLVFEKATDEATWSEMYARLCRKMMEQISSNVQDDGIKNPEGKPITGGQLFRKYLLNRCQEDFERGWVAKEATAAAAASKALEDEAKAAKTKEGGTDEIVLYSEEYYAAQKAKRQGLGLIKFIGELFKLQMLTERIMHACVKKLLGNVDNPEEEEIESLCKLLGTVGSMLDNQKSRARVDVYFSRMKELMKSPNVTPRMQYMLQDLLELRERKWITRNAVAAPSTIAQIHENAAKEKAAQEKESYQRQISMSRGGSRRGGDRGEFNPQQVGPDGWAVAGSGSGPPRPPTKAGDLSNFGKISKTQPLTFGPSSVFAGKKGAENKREAISRTNSSSNMFSMLSSQGAEAGDKEKEPAAAVAPAAAEPLPQRKRLVLQPRSVPVDLTSPTGESESSHSEEEASIEMTEEAALKKISEDLKEFFAVRNLEEAEVYFSGLPPQHHHSLVDKIVSTAVESKEDDAKLVSQFFVLAASKELCSAASFEEGLTPVAELIDDIAIDAPKAFQLLAMMVKGAGLDQERLSNLASKSLDGDKFLALLQ